MTMDSGLYPTKTWLVIPSVSLFRFSQGATNTRDWNLLSEERWRPGIGEPPNLDKCMLFNHNTGSIGYVLGWQILMTIVSRLYPTKTWLVISPVSLFRFSQGATNTRDWNLLSEERWQPGIGEPPYLDKCVLFNHNTGSIGYVLGW